MKIRRFKLFTDCIPVKGKRRSIIYDLTRLSFRFIPNDLYDYLIKNNGIIRRDEINEEYFNFLEKEEFIFSCSEKEDDLFTHIKINYETPYIINHVILEVNNKTNFINEQLFVNLEKLGCINLQIKILDKDSLLNLHHLLSYTHYKRIKSIELILPYDDIFINELSYNNSFEINDRIVSIILYSTPKEITQELNNKFKASRFQILFFNQNMNSCEHCGFVSPRYFCINMEFFMESKIFNNCLNKKVAIDSKGNIKNCLGLKDSYGNIKDKKIEDIVVTPEFQKYWYINKDKIEVCKDCEFRYMCSDCRAFTLNKNMYGKPLKCYYNPSTMKWE